MDYPKDYTFDDLEYTFLRNLHSYRSMHHSRYTTSLRNITYDYIKDNNLGEFEGYNEPIPTIDRCRDILFTFEYPIINTTITSELMGTVNIKDMFELAFISKYFTDEIAFESFAEFQMRLRGRLFEVIPLFNLKMNLLLSLRLQDLKGGYHLEESTNNTHSDNNTNQSNTVGTNKNIGSEFPVNYVNAIDELEDINYASTGNSGQNVNNTTGSNDNVGEYETIHIADKTDRNMMLHIFDIMNGLQDLIKDTLNEFGTLFMGIY